MIVRFLGTSAGELYPGIWCRCQHCQRARSEAKSRRQSAALYVEAESAPNSSGILIDFPSEIVSQADRHGIDLPGLHTLLVTHSHGDHWFPYQLRWRHRPSALSPPGELAPYDATGPRHTEIPILHIWGNANVEAVLQRELGDDLEPFALAFHPVRPEDTFPAGGFTVTALAANHDVGREEAVHYILQTGDRTILYGLDGDTFLPATRERLRAFRFDLVILEATFGLGEGGNHRNFKRLIAEVRWLREEGLLKAEGQIVATHFSPHHCPPHAETSAYLLPHAILAAWDGMEIRL
ncbi:MAG TPA: MBL fold metallo-hydrolase [Chthonomonadaceae bacterium]|nr:MBL fold metallo-hydrolase [Chthonomonadaceae bacterium]